MEIATVNTVTNTVSEQDELINNAKNYQSHQITDFSKLKYSKGDEVTINGQVKTVCPASVPNNYSQEYLMEKANNARRNFSQQFSFNLDMLSYNWAPQWYKFGTMGADATGICQNNYFRDEEATICQNVLGENVNFIS